MKIAKIKLWNIYWIIFFLSMGNLSCSHRSTPIAVTAQNQNTPLPNPQRKKNNLDRESEADRREKRALFQNGGYNFQAITRGMRPLEPADIRAFSLIDRNEITRLKQAYLDLPQIQNLSYSLFLTYFDRFAADLEGQFFDFTYLDTAGNPTRPLSLAAALQGIRTIVSSGEYTLAGGGASVDFKFSLKRSLEYLVDHEERIPAALIALASGGQHCVIGQTDAIRLVERDIFGSHPGVGQPEPVNFEQSFLRVLDGVRDQIFLRAIGFVDDRETGVTENVTRNDLAEVLKIAPGYPEMYSNCHYTGEGVTNRTSLCNLVRTRFFQGKIGQPHPGSGYSSDNPSDLERRRSHPGYNTVLIAQEMAWAIYKNRTRHPQTLDFRPELDRLLVQADGIQVRDYVLTHPREFAAMVLMEDAASLTDDEVQSILPNLRALPEDELRRMYTEILYFNEYRPDPTSSTSYRIINSEGIRKLMILLQLARMN